MAPDLDNPPVVLRRRGREEMLFLGGAGQFALPAFFDLPPDRLVPLLIEAQRRWSSERGEERSLEAVLRQDHRV